VLALVPSFVLDIDGVPVSVRDLALAALLLDGPGNTDAVLRLRRSGRVFTVRSPRRRAAPPGPAGTPPGSPP
jgi:hypothetical protein